METVTILRELWRLRLLVLVVAVAATAVGMAVAFKLPSLESRKYEVGVATVRILVDTPASQVVEVAPEGSEALGVRANLLGNLMVEGEVKDAIAERAGLAHNRLAGVSELTADPAAAATKDPRGYQLSTKVLAGADGERLPIIEVEAQAPDAVKAAALADAAVTGLRGYLDSKAAVEKVTDARRLRVSGLGAGEARNVVRGPRMMMSVGAGLFAFIAGCVLLLMFFALVRAWQTLARRPYVPQDDAEAAAVAALHGLDDEPDDDEGRTVPFPAPRSVDDLRDDEAPDRARSA